MDKLRYKASYRRHLPQVQPPGATLFIMFGRWDKVLDSAPYGPHWLQDEEIAAMVADRLHYLDNQK